MKIGCSACLLGHHCKYNGKHNRHAALLRKLEGHEVVPVCPEVVGGLPVPRTPCEIVQDRILDKEGRDVTDAFETGADAELEKVKDCDLVILQPRSPSCGLSQIYDGTFTGTLIPGKGVFARKLEEQGIPCMEADAFVQEAG